MYVFAEQAIKASQARFILPLGKCVRKPAINNSFQTTQQQLYLPYTKKKKITREI